MRHHPFILVIKDLWYFVTSEVRYWLPLPQRVELLPDYKQSQLSFDVPKTPLLLAPSNNTITPIEGTEVPILEEDCESLFLADTSLPEEDLADMEVDEDEEGEIVTIPQYFESYDPAVMYVSIKEAICVIRPERDFDTVLAKFPYGTAVTVTGYQGNYAKVFWSHHEGWILKDSLTPHKSQVWPHFTDGKIYQADSNAVKKLRLLINDTFYAEELCLPLQAGEWVVYRLREQNRLIPWPVAHGRVPGDWQILLKGVPGVHISITPKADSIMEWRGEDGIGRVAYVEKVTTEQTLVVTIAGFDTPGRFEEKTFLDADWREMRPVFIDVL